MGKHRKSKTPASDAAPVPAAKPVEAAAATHVAFDDKHGAQPSGAQQKQKIGRSKDENTKDKAAEGVKHDDSAVVKPAAAAEPSRPASTHKSKAARDAAAAGTYEINSLSAFLASAPTDALVRAQPRVEAEEEAEDSDMDSSDDEDERLLAMRVAADDDDVGMGDWMARYEDDDIDDDGEDDDEEDDEGEDAEGPAPPTASKGQTAAPTKPQKGSTSKPTTKEVAKPHAAAPGKADASRGASSGTSTHVKGDPTAARGSARGDAAASSKPNKAEPVNAAPTKAAPTKAASVKPMNPASSAPVAASERPMPQAIVAGRAAMDTAPSSVVVIRNDAAARVSAAPRSEERTKSAPDAGAAAGKKRARTEDATLPAAAPATVDSRKAPRTLPAAFSTSNESHCVYVGGLGHDIDTAAVSAALAQFGAVKRVHLEVNNSGKPAGFGYAEFQKPSSASAAIAASTAAVGERHVRLAAYTNAMNYRTPDGKRRKEKKRRPAAAGGHAK